MFLIRHLVLKRRAARAKFRVIKKKKANFEPLCAILNTLIEVVKVQVCRICVVNSSDIRKHR